ncbi:hypothetical protein OGATHE_004872 [Ogataea polymorpha]|uniref:Uncharacterized protein n=1 Tax=Ogataea polymorpha TaxID=460523 RepID=A0A9P8P1A2_9ASCO|nr:hypothetical protein OGATHE_004872 [Ogataea polymorpha]
MTMSLKEMLASIILKAFSFRMQSIMRDEFPDLSLPFLRSGESRIGICHSSLAMETKRDFQSIGSDKLPGNGTLALEQTLTKSLVLAGKSLYGLINLVLTTNLG